MLKFPNTLVKPLARPTSDHVRCVVSIETYIPKEKSFCFEKYWIRLPGFLDKVKIIWDISCPGDSAKCLSAKFELLRKGLKQWNLSILVLNAAIKNFNWIILMVDELSKSRTLHISE
jgi:hypothetical protein